jgi:Lrp/AsnC family transcriptional regulator for asnA, asnC and gidA
MKVSLQKMLDELLLDSSETFTRLGRKLRLSPQGTGQRVASLEEKGIITGYPSIIDPAHLGYSKLHVIFTLRPGMKEKRRKLEKELLEKTSVTAFFSLDFGGTFFITLSYPNTSRFNKDFCDISSRHSDIIENLQVMHNMVTHNYFPSFSKRRKRKDLITGGDREVFTLETDEIEILNGLREDSRKSAVSFADSLSKSVQTVLNRIKGLKKRNILKGFTINIDPEKIGYKRYLVLSKTTKYHRLNESSLERTLLEEPAVQRFHKVIGRYNVVIEILDDPKTVDTTLSRIDDALPSESFVLLPVKKLEKFVYCPEIRI